jgi:Leucine-rich repeat (LRR) protein
MEEMKASKEVKDVKSEIKLEGKSISCQMILNPNIKEDIPIKKLPANLRLNMHDYLVKVSHLQLEHKGLELITNLENCPNLRNLYLQENRIYTLVNDPFKGLGKL